MTRKVLFTGLFILSSFAGCISRNYVHPLLEQDPNAAFGTVVAVRKGGDLLTPIANLYSLDGKSIWNLFNKGFDTLRLPPGTYRVGFTCTRSFTAVNTTTWTSKHEYSITVKPGETYFVHCSMAGPDNHKGWIERQGGS